MGARIVPVVLLGLGAATCSGQASLITAYGSYQEELGSVVRYVGDVDGDGVGDVVTTAEGNNSFGVPPAAKVLSGADGTVLRAWTPVSNMAGVDGCGDVNGDGVPDVVIGGVPTEIRSGATGFPLVSIPSPGVGFIGEHAAGVGDVDGDGTPDVALSAVNTADVLLFSGANGQLIRTLAVGGQSDAPRIARVRDIDGDGRSEVLVSIPDSNPNDTVAKLFSGGSGAQLHVWSMVGVQFGYDVCDAGDVDGDGFVDVAVGYREAPNPVTPLTPGAVHVYSGLSGALIREIFAPSGLTDFGRSLTLLGDLNADGREDLGVGAFSTFSAISGATGAELMRIDTEVTSLDLVPDLDGDGLDDFLIGSRTFTLTAARQGRVQVVSGRIFAATAPLPVSCAGGPLAPVLATGRPILGGSASVLVQDGSPGSTSVLLVGPPAFNPVPLGFPGCEAWVDPATALPFATVVVPATGTWSVSVAVPFVPQAAGVVLHAQTVFFGTSGPLGFDLSNGVMLRLGA